MTFSPHFLQPPRCLAFFLASSNLTYFFPECVHRNLIIFLPSTCSTRAWCEEGDTKKMKKTQMSRKIRIRKLPLYFFLALCARKMMLCTKTCLRATGIIELVILLLLLFLLLLLPPPPRLASSQLIMTNYES